LADCSVVDLDSGCRIAAIAPLVGLLGTVFGMIEAFQSLLTAGSGVDPLVLAGGLWEALLTTAAGMAVAIPASILASWCDGIAECAQIRMDDVATRAFNEAVKRSSPLRWPLPNAGFTYTISPQTGWTGPLAMGFEDRCRHDFVHRYHAGIFPVSVDEVVHQQVEFIEGGDDFVALTS
jgi:hypothetical protein